MVPASPFNIDFNILKMDEFSLKKKTFHKYQPHKPSHQGNI